MPRSAAPTWAFRARFRRRAFGWRSRPAIERIEEAVREIRSVARTEPARAAEGAVLFIEKLVPAIEQVDGSSGSIGSATNRAIEACVAVIIVADADVVTRERWLERLWAAYTDDGFGYLDTLPDRWGDLCVSPAIASCWAERLLASIRELRAAQSAAGARHGYLKEVVPHLATLLKAGRHKEILDFLDAEPLRFWPYHEWGFRALAAEGRIEDALRYAEPFRERGGYDGQILRACEEMLIALGRADEAYAGYGLRVAADAVGGGGSYLSVYRLLVKRYPSKEPRCILDDLVASTPGCEGSWFAAAKAAGRREEAIRLANLSPCDPRTLARAARDFVEKDPSFAMEAALAALRWIARGVGYEITNLDVMNAYRDGLRAAESLSQAEAFQEQVRAIVCDGGPFLRDALRLIP